MDMDMLPSTSEIVESTDELGFNSKMDEKAGKCSISKSGNRYSIEDDINRLFESVNFRNSAKGVGLSNDSGRDALRKKAMKRPIRVGSPQMSGIGISEPVSLKQALRGLCISQASEVAAMKRLSRPAAPSGPSEAGAIRRLYRAVVVEASGAGLPLNEGSGNLVEISLVPESIILNSSDKFLNASHVAKEEFSDQTARSSRDKVLTELTGFGGEILTGKVGTLKTSPEKLLECSDMTQAHCSVQTAHLSQDELCPCSSGFGTEMMAGVGRLGSLGSSSTHHPIEESQQVDEIASTSGASVKTPMPEEQKDVSNTAPLPSISSPGGISSSSAWNSPRFMKPIFRGKSFIRRKMKQDSDSTLSSSKSCNRGVRSDQDPCTSNLDNGTHECASRCGKEESRNAALACKSISPSAESNPSIAGATSSKLGSTSNSGNRNGYILNKIDDRSRSREKGEFSQSSKSSIGDYSSSTSISEDSNLSSSSRSGNRPHMSRDLRWDAVRHIQKQHGNLCLKHFKLTKKLGCGDIGSVYLAELCGTGCLFALKVMDNEFLSSRKKMSRAQTEKEILQMLDHPFLPTLYAHFLSDKFSCLVMEYCPGGDLHVLRQKQPSRTFSEQAARFYIAEVLLALEYLHMLGVVYRDLKPENVLVREDGHIMLTDFDLSLRCAVDPILLQSTSPVEEPTRKVSSPCSESSCIDPFCLHPAWQVSCFTPRLLSVAAKSRKLKSDVAAQVSPLPQLVVEPTSARSNSFVGTHEYLAPEIIKGEGHGSAVDWWTFGIFLFELLYGRTPFKGSGNEETMSNVVSRSLKFPSSPAVSYHARDLIRGLLIKEPENRLGSAKGATEIRQHPFFEGLSWALIRCAAPPELPKVCDAGVFASTASPQDKDSAKSADIKGKEESTEFEMF